MTNTAYLDSLGITRWVQRDTLFAKRAEQLLTAMIKNMGFMRDDVYVATCTQSLDQQIAVIKPKLILAIGQSAAHYLLKTKASLASLRNHIHYYGENKTPLIATYHPADLLRNPKDKKEAYQDLQFALATLHSS